MPLISLTCPHCFSDIQLDDTREFGFCMYCGKKMMIDEILAPEGVGDDSTNISELLSAAETAVMHDDLETASECIYKVMEVDFHNPVAWMLKGGVAAKDRRWPEAMSAWRRAFTLDSDRKNTCRLLEMWAELSAGALFEEVRAQKQNPKVSFMYEILNDVGIPRAGHVYEMTFDKILKYDYRDADAYETCAHMYTRNALIQAAVYSGNDVDRMLARCRKWEALLDSYAGSMKRLEDYIHSQGFISKKYCKDVVDALEAMVREGRQICSVFMKELSDTTAAERAEMKEYWTAHPEERFEIFSTCVEANHKLFEARRKFTYYDATKRIMREYETELKRFVTTNNCTA